jgi:hypothetical protein
MIENKIFRRARQMVLAGLITAALVLLGTVTARAQIYGPAVPVGGLTYGGTNNIAGATTNSYGLTNTINATKYNNVAVSCGVAGLQSSNTSAVTFVFKQSLDATAATEETTATYKVVVTMNGTNIVVVTTNIALNAVGYLSLDSIGVPSATGVTNVSLYQVQKPTRALY